jgi:hypothetical protein
MFSFEELESCTRENASVQYFHEKADLSRFHIQLSGHCVSSVFVGTEEPFRNFEDKHRTTMLSIVDDGGFQMKAATSKKSCDHGLPRSEDMQEVSAVHMAFNGDAELSQLIEGLEFAVKILKSQQAYGR